MTTNPKDNKGSTEEEERAFDEKMIEDWLDADAHSNRLPAKFNFSDMELIGELLNPRIKAHINTLLSNREREVLEELRLEKWPSHPKINKNVEYGFRWAVDIINLKIDEKLKKLDQQLKEKGSE